jgi:uncharacterized protein
MLLVLSPAKTLDLGAPPVTPEYSQPRLLEHSQRLIELLRGYSVSDLAERMKLSRKLAELNFARYQDWSPPFTPANAKPAVLAMRGDAYVGLDPDRFDATDFAFAQRHLRLLSGLYGVLRPLDLMQAYRLEMGTRLANAAGKDLYAFWGDTITEWLNRDLGEQGDAVLVNLASHEYFAAVRPGRLAGRIVQPVFKEHHGSGQRIIGLFAKRARGLMSQFVVRHRISDPEGLKGFDLEGYRYAPELSVEEQWVFARGGDTRRATAH